LIAGAALAALAIVGCWIASRQPTYAAPPGDQIDILLELAGVFPDKYAIMWREHQMLRATDEQAQRDPSLLKDALFLHIVSTGSRQDGEVYVEVGYRFYAFDHRIDAQAPIFRQDSSNLGKLAAEEAVIACACDTLDQSSTSCFGRLGFGNYEFSLTVAYNRQQCTEPIDPRRRDEFRRAMQTADRLIALYLEPLRRKPRWL